MAWPHSIGVWTLMAALDRCEGSVCGADLEGKAGPGRPILGKQWNNLVRQWAQLVPFVRWPSCCQRLSYFLFTALRLRGQFCLDSTFGGMKECVWDTSSKQAQTVWGKFQEWSHFLGQGRGLCALVAVKGHQCMHYWGCLWARNARPDRMIWWKRKNSDVKCKLKLRTVGARRGTRAVHPASTGSRVDTKGWGNRVRRSEIHRDELSTFVRKIRKCRRGVGSMAGTGTLIGWVYCEHLKLAFCFYFFSFFFSFFPHFSQLQQPCSYL